MEEIFEIGRRCHVDMAVLGGDLFHINKPTRSTMVRTMEIFRKHTRGGRDLDLIVRGKFGRTTEEGVNFEDENQAVDLPVFIIHGNHDDPTRDGGQFQALSALDLLQSNGLVNYFGRVQKMDDAVLEPVLIEKGSAKLRLYGMGWIRDERMHRMFSKGQVSFKRHLPGNLEEDESEGGNNGNEEDEDNSMSGEGASARDRDWLNVFMVHQNRDFKGRGAKNCFNDEMIPAFINLVFFGHEHESMIEPQESIKNPETFLSQPGSSVATSLIAAEAEPKHVGIMEIQIDSENGVAKFDLTPVRLRTVRPFIMDEIILEDIDALDKDASEADKVDAVQRVIAIKVSEMIEQARESFRELNPTASASEVKKMLPLIRLRVEHTSFPVLNLQRFGDKFIGKVANPKDLVFFFRRRKLRERGAKSEGGLDDEVDVAADEISAGTRINGLIEDILSGDNKLTFIPDRELHFNIQEYVEKGEARLLETYLDDYIKTSQALILRQHGASKDDDNENGDDDTFPEDDEKIFQEDSILEQVRKVADKRNRNASLRLSKALDPKDNEAAPKDTRTQPSIKSARGKKKASTSSSSSSSSALRQTTLSSFSRQQNDSDDSEADDFAAVQYDDVSDSEQGDSGGKVAKSKAPRKGRQTKSATSAKSSAASKSKSTATSTSTARRKRPVADIVLDSSDDDDDDGAVYVGNDKDDDDDDEDSDEEEFGARARARAKSKRLPPSRQQSAAQPKGKATRGRRAARKSVSYAESADEIEDSADESVPSPKSKRRRR
ncbi:Double-strand break repair protein MRE11 [Hondaea fermentalgiana]|uniref:Double-strand break repair protein n=1 Tax=Hondaea fermentalgiana TaxID=2315210 RepID=A0A2R5G959_9STRA|nr:Double-strand break repair protein MRE11 [Hondaea fermentalgiana]|eukprot:GBG26869.1 Double-strand break repair protein MRE11 [Hondaea fermentalgiana]